eukprot:TRINITY_DN48979_c0_g1_i1.p1 TRINITY_DN48979_c0_g1~~TRINITY_DN48979_c0_g1_i1.p1  ORF type:complete len:546 (+),score=53.75 TRINITY_DN48979_c0_g1_i1:84-1721(+)
MSQHGTRIGCLRFVHIVAFVGSILFRAQVALCISAFRAIERGRGRDTEHDCPTSFEVSEFPPSECAGNVYFIDWGSTGFKVYKVHETGNQSGIDEDALDDIPASEVMAGSEVVVKVKGINADTPPCAVTSTLDELRKRIEAVPGTGGAVLATSGMRLKPTKGRALLRAVREWADANSGMFRRCGSNSTNEDCRTLPGNEEGMYEMRALLSRDGPARFLSDGMGRDKWEKPYAFASCGGGSLQLGLRGDTATLWQCVRDLGDLDTLEDSKRVAVQNVYGAPALLVSFLSSHTPEHPPTCESVSGSRRVCDYVVGGVNEMRANFDNFLVSRGQTRNPCLSPFTRLQTNDKCTFYGSSTTDCVIDEWGGTVSRLQAAKASLTGSDRAKQCQDLVNEFIAGDLMLSRWNASSACTSLANMASKWGLLSAYTSLTAVPPKSEFLQVLSVLSDATSDSDNIHKPVKFDEVRTLGRQYAAFATEKEVNDGEAEGRYVTLALLTRFLEVLGVKETAKLRKFDSVDWPDRAIADRGLRRGWRTIDSNGKRCNPQ